jgi:hypothetical protein
MNRLKVHIPKGTRSAGLRLTSRVGAIAGPAGTCAQPPPLAGMRARGSRGRRKAC